MRTSSQRLTMLLMVAGWLSVALIGAGTSVALIWYRGPFTRFNLTISELGLRVDSPAADLFNAGLIGGGICLAVFLVGVGAQLGRPSGALFAALGASTGVATSLVGAFPVDQPLHQVVGPACFMSGLLSSLLFARHALLRGRGVTARWLALPSLATSACLGIYISMPLLLVDGVNQVFAAPGAVTRPALWVVSISEWLALGAVLAWVSAVSWQLARLRQE